MPRAFQSPCEVETWDAGVAGSFLRWHNGKDGVAALHSDTGKISLGVYSAVKNSVSGKEGDGSLVRLKSADSLEAVMMSREQVRLLTPKKQEKWPTSHIRPGSPISWLIIMADQGTKEEDKAPQQGSKFSEERVRMIAREEIVRTMVCNNSVIFNNFRIGL